MTKKTMAPAEPDEPEPTLGVFQGGNPWEVYISGKPNQAATTTFTDIKAGFTFPSATRIAELEAKIAELENRLQSTHAAGMLWCRNARGARHW